MSKCEYKKDEYCHNNYGKWKNVVYCMEENCSKYSDCQDKQPSDELQRFKPVLSDGMPCMERCGNEGVYIHLVDYLDQQSRIEELEDGYVSYRKAYCEAESQRIKLSSLLDDAEKVLEMIERWKDAYPEDVFRPLVFNDYESMCGDAGYSVDSVSAHVMRGSVKAYSDTATDTLRKIQEKK